MWLGRCTGPYWQLVPPLLPQGKLSPLSFRPMNTAWRVYVCLSVCVLRRLWQWVGEKRCSVNSTRNSWMCGRTHWWQWPNHDGDSTTSTWKGKSLREQNFASDDTVMQQSLNEKSAITHFNYTFIQGNVTWVFLANNSKDASITVHHHWLCNTHKKNSKYLNNLSDEQVLNCFHCKKILIG